jgi:hypothetical protein
MIDNWDDDFIPPEIQDNIICLGRPDHHEREGYTVSLQAGNYENDLHAAQDEVFHADDPEALMTGSVYTDINSERQNPNIRMIDTLLGMVASNPYRTDEIAAATDCAADDADERERGPGNIRTISYAIRGRSTLMNNWEDPYYFTAAFPTLFPEGIGGHQDQRPIPISLMAFAEWALNHHSRRFVALIDCYKNLMILTDSHVIKPSCTFSTMSYSSGVLPLEIHYL